jgi:hypothetical protein
MCLSRIALLLFTTSWIGPLAGTAATSDEIAGVFTLVSVEATAGGEVSHPLGRAPKGLLILTPNGFWSAQLMAEAHTQPGDDALRSYRAHFGTYTLDEGARKLVLHREGDLDAAGVGSDTLRLYAFEGKRVTMTLPPENRGGVEVTTRVVWERVEAFPSSAR